MMHKEKNYTGNNRFYGFCVDLLEAVSKGVGFNYRLELVEDRKYGAKDPETGEWNGIVNELMRHVCLGLFYLKLFHLLIQQSFVIRRFMFVYYFNLRIPCISSLVYFDCYYFYL